MSYWKIWHLPCSFSSTRASQFRFDCQRFIRTIQFYQTLPVVSFHVYRTLLLRLFCLFVCLFFIARDSQTWNSSKRKWNNSPASADLTDAFLLGRWFHESRTYAERRIDFRISSGRNGEAHFDESVVMLERSFGIWVDVGCYRLPAFSNGR